MRDAFYLRDGARFIATAWTRGPWDPNSQHAGPPTALLGRAIEALPAAEGHQVARITVELLRSIPMATFDIRARISRPGRRVQLAEAALADDGGDVAIATAWLVRRRDGAADQTAVEAPPFPLPTIEPSPASFDRWGGPSYFSAVEWRFAAGSPEEPGPATVWMRMRLPLVDGEEPSPLTRVLVAADSGNGISLEHPITTHLSINTELSVHLTRDPAGDWVCLDARTLIGPGGVGLAESALYDTGGRFGSSAQSLLVAPIQPRRMLAP